MVYMQRKRRKQILGVGLGGFLALLFLPPLVLTAQALLNGGGAVSFVDALLPALFTCAVYWFTAFYLIYAAVLNAPIFHIVHAILCLAVIPDRVDQLAHEVCAAVQSKQISFNPGRQRFLGPFYLASEMADSFRSYETWRGSCAYKTGWYGFNGGPWGEEFYIEFYGAGDNPRCNRVALEFSLIDNLSNYPPFIGGWSWWGRVHTGTPKGGGGTVVKTHGNNYQPYIHGVSRQLSTRRG